MPATYQNVCTWVHASVVGRGRTGTLNLFFIIKFLHINMETRAPSVFGDFRLTRRDVAE